jgi:hypothetical protein
MTCQREWISSEENDRRAECLHGKGRAAQIYDRCNEHTEHGYEEGEEVKNIGKGQPSDIAFTSYRDLTGDPQSECCDLETSENSAGTPEGSKINWHV